MHTEPERREPRTGTTMALWLQEFVRRRHLDSSALMQSSCANKRSGAHKETQTTRRLRWERQQTIVESEYNCLHVQVRKHRRCRRSLQVKASPQLRPRCHGQTHGISEWSCASYYERYGIRAGRVPQAPHVRAELCAFCALREAIRQNSPIRASCRKPSSGCLTRRHMRIAPSLEPFISRYPPARQTLPTLRP